MSDQESPRITFIGGGNMARSLAGGLIAAGGDARRITISEPSAQQRSRLQSLGEVNLTDDNAAAVAQADVVVLAVKPQVMQDVLEPLAPQLAERRPLLISIAAGITTEALTRWAGDDLPVVRCMPNTPALLGAGMNVLFATAAVDAAQRELAAAILAAAGAVRWIDDEALMDLVTGVSGSGPAYFFLMMEAMQAAGEAGGLDAETAHALAVQTALGAARMAAEGDATPAELREQVTSPNGTTQRALEVLAEGDVAGWIRRAVNGAAQRSRELAREMDEDA